MARTIIGKLEDAQGVVAHRDAGHEQGGLPAQELMLHPIRNIPRVQVEILIHDDRRCVLSHPQGGYMAGEWILAREFGQQVVAICVVRVLYDVLYEPLVGWQRLDVAVPATHHVICGICGKHGYLCYYTQT